MQGEGRTMAAAFQADLKGDALKAQRFQMLEDIAEELSGEEVVFPTCFDVALRIRKALQDPDIALGKLVALINMEPLLSAKLLQQANSAAYNPGNSEVRHLEAAIQRLGLNLVRNTAMAVAMGQMLRARDMAGFDDIARKLWLHTVHAASACYVIARHFTRINPEEAMFAGLVHDLGAFYMLYRATKYEELRARPETLKYLIIRWHESIGLAVLASLGLPEEMVEALRDHDVLRPAPAVPKTLRDVVYVGNLIAGGIYEWDQHSPDEQDYERPEMNECYLALCDEIEARRAEMLAVFN